MARALQIVNQVPMQTYYSIRAPLIVEGARAVDKNGTWQEQMNLRRSNIHQREYLLSMYALH
jgi:hypothetical protein